MFKRLRKPTSTTSSEATVEVIADDCPFATGISIRLRKQFNWIDIPHDQVFDCELTSKFPWFWPWYNTNDLSLLLPSTYRDLYFNMESRIVAVRHQFVMEWNKIIPQ